jgi:GT2 family glycosyltransferase
LSNEDTEFGNRLLQGGERLRFEPGAVIHHPVQASRVEKAYFLAWWFAKARSDIREFGIPADARWFLAGVPLRLFRRLAVSIVRWIVTLQPRRRFGAKVRVWGRLGEIAECYRLAHPEAAAQSGSVAMDSKRVS